MSQAQEAALLIALELLKEKSSIDKFIDKLQLLDNEIGVMQSGIDGMLEEISTMKEAFVKHIEEEKKS